MKIQPVMVSVDEMTNVARTGATYEVPFPILSDPDAQVHDAYKVANTVGDKGLKRLNGLGIDVEAWSKRKHHKIAIPSIFLIDGKGTVRFAHAAKDHRTRPKLDALLPALEKALQ